MQRLSPKEGTVPLSYRYYYYYYLCIVYDRVYHATPPPAPIFHCLYLHSSNSAGAKKESAVETSRRAELSGDVSFGVGTLLVVEQTSLETPPQGGVIDTVVYGSREHSYCGRRRRTQHNKTSSVRRGE